MRKREIRDPVHGFIHRRDAEYKIIDTPIFQRLRRIKQLAMANLVYPGATHTRFDHSIGVMHVAGLMAEILLDDPDEIEIVRLAALLHDIGHGPLSHVSENILEIFAPHEQLAKEREGEVHELITAKIIGSDPDILRILGEERAKQIADILKSRVDPLLAAIVSGPVDADKQDYLLRDSLFCGVKYGIFDTERLHNTLTSYEDKEERFLGIVGPDGIHALEQYILAKYYMTTQVYRHKVRLITDTMIVRALELGITKDNMQFLKDLYTYSESEDYIRNYVSWDDEKIVAEVMRGNDNSWTKKIFARLVNRNLFKRVFQAEITLFPEYMRDVLSNISNPKWRERRTDLEQKIAEKIGVEKEFVIVFSFTIKSVRERTRDSEASILVVSEGEKKAFEDVSTLFRSIDGAMQDKFVEVYAPVTYADDQDKRKKRAEFSENINGIILDFYKRKEVQDEFNPA